VHKCSQNTDSETLKLQNHQFHNQLSFFFFLLLFCSLSVSIYSLALCVSSSNPLCACLRCLFRSFTLSVSIALAQVRDSSTFRWRKASSIYQTISFHLSLPITPGPPKVLHAPILYFIFHSSFIFNVSLPYRFRFAYLMDLLDSDLIRG
jgi:hypothetical protein